MAGETIITVVGNLTADPEVRALSNGASVASFTIASTSRTFNRNTNQFEDGPSLFMRCSAWRDLAEHCAYAASQAASQGMQSQATNAARANAAGANVTGANAADPWSAAPTNDSFATFGANADFGGDAGEPEF